MPKKVEVIWSNCPQCGAQVRSLPCLQRIYCSNLCRGAAKKRPAAEMFWEKVNKDGPIPESCPERGPCWLWDASTYPDSGYGQFRNDEVGQGYAHRASWELTYGPLPAGAVVGHHCDNPPCVRPTHLFSGGQGKNVRDMFEKGRGHNMRPRRHHRTLNMNKAREIRRLYSAGETQDSLAERFDVTRPHISAVVNHKIWRE